MAYAAKSIELNVVDEEITTQIESEQRKKNYKQATYWIKLFFKALILFFDFFFQPELKKAIGPNQPSRQVYAPRWDRDLY